MHALTFGIFGEQKDRTQKYVEGQYKIQERKDDQGDQPQQMEEVHEEHEISQLKNHKQKKLIKVEKE